MSYVAAADLLDRLASAGNTLKVEAPDTLLVGGPLTDEQRAEIRSLKGSILEVMAERRRTRAHPCSGCGQFSFREPTVVCWWCTNDKHEAPAADAARAETPSSPPTISRACPSCGGGLQGTDAPGAACWGCTQHQARSGGGR